MPGIHFFQTIGVHTACVLFVMLFLRSSINGQTPVALPNAHAHNDYEHNRPLFDALEQGFTSLEADVHLIEGQLFVVHDRPAKTAGVPTLADLYLEPLRQVISRNGGQVYSGYDGPFLLMIDIKTGAEPTYAALQPILERYADILTRVENDSLYPGPVTVFLSGNRPIKTVVAQTTRWVGIDGRPPDLGKGYSPELMPVISDRYSKHFKWKGKGPMPKKEWAHLQNLVTQAHAEGKKVRFWASPENPMVWKTLLRGGADLINTDQLVELREFLLARE